MGEVSRICTCSNPYTEVVEGVLVCVYCNKPISAPETRARPVTPQIIERPVIEDKRTADWRREKERILTAYVEEKKAPKNLSRPRLSKTKKVEPPKTKKKLGRPKLGKEVKCQDCGATIYLKPYQIRKGAGKYCQHCFHKHVGGFKLSLTGLVNSPQFEKYTVEEAIARTVVILVKWLQQRPEQTVRELDVSQPFTAKDILDAALEALARQVLDSRPEFDKLDTDLYRLKSFSRSSEPLLK